MPENYKQLFQQYLNDSLSDEEAEKLINAIREGAYAGELIPDEIFAQEAMLNSDIEVDKELIYKQLKSRMDSDMHYPPVSRVHLLKTAWLRYAAAIIVLSGAALYFWNTRSVKSLPAQNAGATSVNKEVLPGGNKATLTLADGSVIVLDSAMNGNIAQQGASVVRKSADGEIIYHPDQAKVAQTVGYNTMTTPRGGQYRLQLPDGSEVWLNAASSITYPTFFEGKDRRVSITGEAYFEIAKDAARPFYVQKGDIEVRVYGTHFNINTYDDEDDARVTLLEGSVKVSKGTASSTLEPGQQAKVKKDRNIELVRNADTEAAVAWKNGYFELKGYGVEELMRQIARWYDVDISYEGAPPARQFAGQLQRSLNLSETLRILEESNVHFKVEGKRVIVRH